jgi:autotransporter-associated beta strand protein
MKPTIPTPAPRLRLVRRVAGVLATVLLCVVAASRASAATYTWDGGGGNGLWNNAANWNPDGAPTSSIDTSIVLDGSVQLNTNSNVSGNFGMNALTFPATAGAFSIASVGYMSFNTSSTAVVPVLTQNSASNMTLPGIFITGAMTMAGTGTGSVSFAYLQGPLSSAVLTKTSAGTLVLAGDSNGFNGKIMINGGTFQIGNGGAAGSIISGTVIDNATLAFNRSDTYSFDLTVTGTGGVTQKGSGTLVLYRTNTNAGPTLINSGTLQVGDGTTTYASSLGAGDITVNTALVYNRSSSSFAVANNISGPGTVTKLGSGTLTYTGSSSAALTTITGGNMVVATGGQMAGPLLVSAGTSLTVNGTGALAGAGLLTVDGTVASPAVFTLASGSAHARSKVVVGDAGVGSATQSNGNLSGVDQGVILGNTATGSGTYTLSGGSISAGTSAIGSSGAGVFNQTGGSFTTGASVLYVGRFAGASGTFNLSGIGALTTGRTQVSDEANTSIFTQSAGVHTTAVLSLSGRSVSSQGTYNFDGGTLITSQVTSGDNGVHGTSIFNFNGGTLQATASSTTFLQDLTTANVRGTGGVIRGGAAIDTQSYNLTIAQALLHSTIPDDPGID